MYRLLEGLLVLDLAGEPAQMAGRILAVLGARVVRIGEPAGDIRSRAWAAGLKSRANHPLNHRGVKSSG